MGRQAFCMPMFSQESSHIRVGRVHVDVEDGAPSEGVGPGRELLKEDADIWSLQRERRWEWLRCLAEDLGISSLLVVERCSTCERWRARKLHHFGPETCGSDRRYNSSRDYVRLVVLRCLVCHGFVS